MARCLGTYLSRQAVTNDLTEAKAMGSHDLEMVMGNTQTLFPKQGSQLDSR